AGAEAMDGLVEALLVSAFNEGTDEDGERPLPEALRDRHREAAEGLRVALADLRALLAPPPAPLRDHARALDAALFGAQPLVAARLRETDGAGVEMDALRGCLRAVAAADEALAGPPVSFAAFVSRLERELDAPAVLLREPGGVLLAPLHTLHGLRFAYLAVAGLVEGEFPARRTTSSLLDREARGHLAAHDLALPPDPRASEDELWATACTRVDGVLSLWRPRLDERGRPAPPSYYFPDDLPARPEPGAASRRETAIEATAGWLAGVARRPAGVDAWSAIRAAVPVEQRRRSFLGAGTFEGDLPPTSLPALTAPSVAWSATRFESYRTCSFQFFARYALRLRELDEERDGVDPATRGTVIHEILQATLEPLRDVGRPLSGSTLPDALDRLATVGAELWAQAPEKHGFGRAGLWRLDQDSWIDRIARLLEAEATALPPEVERIEGTELTVDLDLALQPPLHIRSQIDRLDAGPNLAVVVDYKSGSSIDRKAVEEGRYLQLQLYAHLARQQTGADRVIARYAFVRPTSKPWELDTALAEDAALVARAVDIAAEVRTDVEAGRFRVVPSNGCPRWCAFQHICRRHEAPALKTWG
ncbi:MAG: PD-(D/E)XK nuclease family protein, partial [Dehalococcoidia bacterium]